MTTSDHTKLFISHSSKTDGNKEILKKICAALDHKTNEGGFQILVDDRIEPDTEWFPNLNEYMMECHAAIILLSEAALASEWVKAEAAVLCARRRSRNGIKLLLVPLDNVNSEQLDKNPFFKTIRIADFQTIRDCQNTEEIINKVSDSLTGLILPPTPFKEMTDLIRGVLNQLNKEDDALVKVLKSLQDEAQSANDPADALARILLRDPENVYFRLRALFEKLAHVFNKQLALKLVDIIQGHWVAPAAASLLYLANEEKRPVAINGIEIPTFTGKCYARKAWPFPQEYTLIPVGKDRTLKEIQETLHETLGRSAISPDRKENRVQNYKYPLLLVFPYPEQDNQAQQAFSFPDENLINEIKDQYKNITVVLSAGTRIPDNLNYVLPLEPLLEEGFEDKQCDGYENVLYYVNNTIGN